MHETKINKKTLNIIICAGFRVVSFCINKNE